MKLKAILLLTLAVIAPGAAQADPVSAFFTAMLAPSAYAASVASALGTLTSFAYSAGAFFATGFGALIANIGLALLLRPSTPGIGEIRVNSRREDSPRWQLGGMVCAGGETGIFGEFDADGNFWYICAHGDSELIGQPSYMLDGIEVTLSDGTDGFTAGDVLTDDFCLDERNRRYEGTGTRVVYYRLYPVTPDAAHVAGAMPADFLAAFPDLPADFLLAGVCHTVVRCKVLRKKDRQNIYHWSGGFRLGEPTVNIIGDFSRVYDPRDPAQDLNDRTTWGSTGSNPALVWAWWRVNPRGRNRPVTEINWDLVADAADACDATVLDRTGTPIPRYRCGVAFPDNRPRHECEAEILRTFAAFVSYDDQGRAYPVPGVYATADLTIYGTRDVLDIETQIVDDGEAAVHGVVVEYISPDHGWTRQRSAPWVNPLYYDGSAEPYYQTISILGCQSHNQAVRLAKDHGLTIGAAKKAAMTVGLKGELVKRRRSIMLDVDAEFSGEFKVASAVENSMDGQSYAFAVVPMSAMQYDLAPGEEGLPPQVNPILDVDDGLEAATGVVVAAVMVLTSSGDAVRIEATFDAPARVDREFAFRFSKQGSGVYEDMTVDMDELRAWTRIVEAGATFEVQWQTTTAGGRASDWSAPVVIIASVAPISYSLLTEPAPDGISRSVSGLPDGTQMVLGDGEWWRRVSNGKIATAARYLSLFDSAEYQIDQVEKTQSQLISLTRPDPATYIDASGVLQTAAANVARIDHATGVPALLVEPSGANAWTYSQEMDNAVWTKTRASITANAGAAPDGTTTADKLVEDTSTGTHYLRRARNFVSGTPAYFSFFVKASGRTVIRASCAGSGMATQLVDINLGTGAVTIVSGTPSVRAYALAGGWWWVKMSFTPNGSPAGFFDLLLINGGANSYAGDGASGVLVWGLQDGAGSYIQTTSAAVTRAADVASLQGITATLDLTVRDGDGIDTVLAGQGVSPGFWPTLTATRIRQIIGRTP